MPPSSSERLWPHSPPSPPTSVPSAGSDATLPGDLAPREAEVLIVDWAESQFRFLGKRDARDLAVALFAGIQGAALLANTFRDPSILTRQTRRLEHWIDALASE